MIEVGTTRRGSMSPMRRLRIWEANKGVCCICNLKIDGVREKWGIEHRRALALGGTDTDDNCGPAHETCMADKTAKADIPAITKAKRRKARHLGIRKASTFPKAPPGFKYSWKTRRMEKAI